MAYKRPCFEIEASYGGAIAMLLLPEDISEEISNWGASHINDEEIYGQEGKGRDGSPHVTLQNGIMCEDSSELEKLFSQLPGMEAELGPIGVFRQDDKDYDVIHIEVICDDLHAANAMVSDLLEVNNPHPDYKPHVTLAYVKRGAGSRFEGLKDFVGRKVPLSKLAIDGPDIESKTLDLSKHEHVDQIPGGLADDKTEADFDPKDLEEGANVELEHTKNIELAREIAMDHLVEDKDYYRKLKKMEGKKACQGSPLKDSIDYGYLAEDVEDHLLSTGRSIRNLAPGELESIIRSMKRDLKE
jgi:2'-5' RNA ligase